MKIGDHEASRADDNRETLGPKEKPASAGQVKHRHHPPKPAQRILLAPHILDAKRAKDAQNKTVVSAPGDEGPACAVPKSAQQHGDDEIAILLAHSLTISAKRNIKIVAQPGRQADVP